MAEAVALVLFFLAVQMQWLDDLGIRKARSAFSSWNRWLQRHGLNNWLLAVPLPALLAGLVDLTIDQFFPQMVLSFLVFFCLLPLSEFYMRGKEVTDAVYCNERERSLAAVTAWMPSEIAIEDSDKRINTRLLGLCALRLHHDLIAVLFWHALLGAAGAVLYFASRSFAAGSAKQQDSSLNVIVELPAACVFAGFCCLAGNFAPAANWLFNGNVQKAALAASDLDGKAIVLERVPVYWSMLLRVLYCALAGSIIFILAVFH